MTGHKCPVGKSCRKVLSIREEIYTLFVENKMKQCRNTLKRHLGSTLSSVRHPGIYERVFQEAFPEK